MIGAATCAMLFRKTDNDELISITYYLLTSEKSKCLSNDFISSAYMGTNVNVENNPNKNSPIRIIVIQNFSGKGVASKNWATPAIKKAITTCLLGFIPEIFFILNSTNDAIKYPLENTRKNKGVI